MFPTITIKMTTHGTCSPNEPPISINLNFTKIPHQVIVIFTKKTWTRKTTNNFAWMLHAQKHYLISTWWWMEWHRTPVSGSLSEVTHPLFSVTYPYRGNGTSQRAISWKAYLRHQMHLDFGHHINLWKEHILPNLCFQILTFESSMSRMDKIKN